MDAFPASASANHHITDGDYETHGIQTFNRNLERLCSELMIEGKSSEKNIRGHPQNTSHEFHDFFTPPRPCHWWSHFWDPLPLPSVTAEMWCHKIRIPLVTQCHNSSTPCAPLTCDVIYGCPQGDFFVPLSLKKANFTSIASHWSDHNFSNSFFFLPP